MSQVKIYIDEDAMDTDLVAALRSRGVIVITVLDAGLAQMPYDQQLAFADAHGCQLGRILRLRAASTPESMRNQVEFLSNWG